MATTTEVGVKITVDGSEATKSVGSIKSQLKEATAELIAMREKFGDTSTEAVNAAKKVANLKDSIGDAKAMADAFNPDAKFKAFGSALQGVAGGFAAVQGAMGLIGSESEDVEKMLLKVNSAMALSQGINSVLEAKDSFKNLGAVLKSFPAIQKAVTVAQQVFNAVMKANPIGLMVTAITALIAGVALLTKYFMDNAKAAKFNETSVKANAKALEQQQKATAKAADELDRAQNYQLAMAKANGATTASIRALELKLIDEKIATQNASRETAINTFEKNKNALASLKQSGASDEVIKKQRETVGESLKFANEQTANLNKTLIERVEIQRKHNVEIATETNTANNDAVQKANERNDRIRENAKKAQEDLKKQNEDYANELRTLQDKNFTDAIKNENDKAEALLTLEFTNNIKRINATKLSEEQKSNLLIEVQKQYQLQLDEINKKRDEEEQKKLDDAVIKEQERIAKNNEQRKKDYENKLKAEAEQTAKEKKESDERIAIAIAERDAKIGAFESIGQSLNILSDLVGKNTEAGKGFAIASLIVEQAVAIAKIVTNTKVANAKSVALFPTTLGQPYVAINTISAGLSIASSIAAVVKGIRAIKGANANGGGASGGGAPSLGGGGGTVAPPLPPQLETQTINAGQVNQLASATARAYVVESDVSGNQERINRLNRASRIN
jgi:hypothetical protein